MKIRHAPPSRLPSSPNLCRLTRYLHSPRRNSVEELLVAIASEVIGATVFAWVIGNLVNLVVNLDPAERNRKSMMNYLTEYMRELPLSSKAKQSICKIYGFHLQVYCSFCVHWVRDRRRAYHTRDEKSTTTSLSYCLNPSATHSRFLFW